MSFEFIDPLKIGQKKQEEHRAEPLILIIIFINIIGSIKRIKNGYW